MKGKYKNECFSFFRSLWKIFNKKYFETNIFFFYSLKQNFKKSFVVDEDELTEKGEKCLHDLVIINSYIRKLYVMCSKQVGNVNPITVYKPRTHNKRHVRIYSLLAGCLTQNYMRSRTVACVGNIIHQLSTENKYAVNLSLHYGENSQTKKNTTKTPKRNNKPAHCPQSLMTIRLHLHCIWVCICKCKWFCGAKAFPRTCRNWTMHIWFIVLFFSNFVLKITYAHKLKTNMRNDFCLFTCLFSLNEEINFKYYSVKNCFAFSF